MKKLLLVPVLALAFVLAGCKTTAFDVIVSVAVPSLTNVLDIVALSSGKPVNATLATKIAADGANLKSVGDSLLVANASATGGCAKFIADLNVFQADITLVEQTAQVSNPSTQAKVNAIVGLVVTTVDGVAAVIPACKTTTSDLQFVNELRERTGY